MNKAFEPILQAINDRRLGKTISLLENLLLSRQQMADMELVDTLKNDYQLMVDYWRQGVSDSQRERLYNQLLRRTYALCENIILHEQLMFSFHMLSLNNKLQQGYKDWSLSHIRQVLENYVTDVALLELEPQHVRKSKAENVYLNHQQFMNDLFDYVLLSCAWKENDGKAFEEMLLSPTIDAIDQQLLISAIMLSCLRMFCINKFLVMTHVYEQTHDEALRQRALVGWAFCMSSNKARLFPEQQETIVRLCSDERCCQELKELQMQVIYCINADNDSKKIKDEILPDLMKGNNVKMTSSGLVEMDEDKLESILHPDAEEQNMERMEESMHKMVELQKQGSDIYYAGFSQMKRFPFFSAIASWFVPFYGEHPSISTIWNQGKKNKILQAITQMGAFCDSDKYSFVLAFDQVLSQLPPSMMEMIEKGEAVPMPVGGEVSLETQMKPAYIRRTYLQNLYRFYRLFPQRSEFVNPFETLLQSDIPVLTHEVNDMSGAFFAESSILRGSAFEKHLADLALFFIKHDRASLAFDILRKVSNEYHDFNYFMIMGYLTMMYGNSMSAVSYYSEALSLQPDNIRAMKSYARALYQQHDYEQALSIFERLEMLLPDNKGIELNVATCLINLKRYDEAAKRLYKLNYNDADDRAVLRALAWLNALTGKYEAAEKLYNRMFEVTADEILLGDYLNYGYCLWFQHKVAEAILQFRQYENLLSKHPHSSYKPLEEEFLQNDKELLLANNISVTDIQLMLDNIM